MLDAENAYHPLFQPGEGQDEEDFPPPTGENQIATLEIRRNANGKEERIPEEVQPHELQSWADVAQRWGGGTYTIRARSVRGRVYASRRETLPGPPKPLGGEPPSPAAHVAAAVHEAPAPGWAGLIAVIAPAVLQMMQQSQQMQMASMQSMTQVLVAAMTGNREHNAAEMNALMGLAGKVVEANRAAPAPAAPIDVKGMRDLVGLLKEVQEQGATGTSDVAEIAQAAGVVGQIIVAAMQAKQAQQQAAAPAPQVVTVESQPVAPNGAPIPQG